MYLPHTVYVVVLAIAYFHPVLCQEEVVVMPPEDDDGGENSKEYPVENEQKNVEPEDKHTFVAIIDIVFTDANKRTCTGTVIHDRVVITAAHCFVNTKNEFVLPELTLSFVVIGTKNMFETGYEHYLPIEKIETHPEFQGWTADLALVYTFAGMQSDKPGKVIPLGGEKAFTPVDSNLTVISWGRCRSENYSATPYAQRVREHEGKQQRGRHWRTHEELTSMTPHYEDYEFTTFYKRGSHAELRRSPGIDTSSRYLKADANMQGLFRGVEFNKTFSRRSLPAADDFSSYKNWRRVMGSQKNELSVELFGFVSVQACRKVVERIMPAMYQIKNVNEILCYSSEDHYITKEDSGAPAIQQGSLVAVTVGGIETEGNHIAIGMKMSCFCPWIADNLPDGGETLECCKDCCDIKHFQDSKRDEKTHKYKLRSNNKKQNKRFLRTRSTTAQYDYEENTKLETFMDFWNKT